MTRPRSALVLPVLAISCASAPTSTSLEGIYSSTDSIIELHRGPDSAWRGYWRTSERIAALAPVDIHGDVIEATATYDDGTRAELCGELRPGPVLLLDGRSYRRSAVEEPADATVRREIEAAYDSLAEAVSNKDYDAFQALRVAEFATIPPDGVPSPGSRMAERARGLLERIQPPIRTTNEILELTVRANDAIATVRQKFTRMQMIEGTPHTIHTEVTQRETWTRTAAGWKLLFVDDVRDHVTLDDGGAGAARALDESPAPAEPHDLRVDRFRQQLEADRERLKIPGLSAVIVENGEVLWTQGFGYTDVERRVPATPDTLFHLASVTKTFTALLVLQLVEQGKLDLDAPVSRYVPEIQDERVRIKHLLSHTSEGTPGERFSYNPERFEHLKAILEKTTGKPLRQLFVETFLEPLAMRDSVPGPDVADDAQTWAVLGEANLERYRQTLSKLAEPYTCYGEGEVLRTTFVREGERVVRMDILYDGEIVPAPRVD